MLDTDGYLRMAASNFQQAESHLKETEEQLHKLVERLENCLSVFKLPEPETRLWEQIDSIVSQQPVTAEGLGIAGS